ncbi:MAG: mechanosensitive ion channel family protein [Candidatus Electrothrix sp. Rat3]|nr:mechanosensitive ion channel family protein [Candidatus Electrothrix rattekaaiensis]
MYPYKRKKKKASTTIPRCFLRYFLLLFLLAGSLSSAAAEEGLPDAEEIKETSAVIETVSKKSDDAKIKQRAEGIFAEIPGLEKVVVTVSEGVVVLSGPVANEESAQRARHLTNRLAGVVIVQDHIERTLNLQENLKPRAAEYADKANRFVKSLPLILTALGISGLILLTGFLLARFSLLWEKITPNQFLAEILAQIIRIIAIGGAILAAMNLLGASRMIGTLLGGAGVVGFAVGFAVKDTIENYIASIMLSLRQPFRPRDFVSINEHQGVVIRLTSRATILMTVDGNHLRIPNAVVFKATILNYTTNPERRFDFTLGIGVNDDPVAATEAGVEAIASLPFILETPPPGSFVELMGDANIVIRFMAWINQTETDFLKARSYAMQKAREALEEQGFSLPVPRYNLLFEESRLPFSESKSESTAKPEAEPEKEPEKEQPVRRERITPVDDIDAMDVRPEQHLQEKVEDERKATQEEDLLDEDSPKE